MDVDDSFYDEISSFMAPGPDDYGLNDLDDIIGSTVSQLDNSLDLNRFVPQIVNDFEIANATLPLTTTTTTTDFGYMQAENNYQLPTNGFNFNFSAFPSPATTNDSNTPSYVSQRTPSTSSIEGDYANLDELMNFLNDDDMKIEELTRDSLLEHMKERNTPSPTESCSSSGGSSTTSGVQSDASSVASSVASSTNQTYTELNETLTPHTHDVESAIFATNIKRKIDNSTARLQIKEELNFSIKDEDTFLAPATPPPAPPTANIIAPVYPIISLPQQQNMNMLPGTLMPVQTMPLTASTLVDIQTPAPIKPKLAPKNTTSPPPPSVKLITKVQPTLSTSSPPKVTPPTNAKPKTIFLTTNDFKALMQKMNTNAKAGVKINGSVNSQMPKIIMKSANGKVVAANKIVQSQTLTSPSTSTTPATAAIATPVATQQAHFVPKIVKSNAISAPMQVKHQPTKLITTNRANLNVARLNAINSIAAVATASPELSVYKGMVDEKMYKKQQRMIKNRESASLSRKKKKEYVVSLEARINNLEKENYKLKGENSSLRNQLVAFAQTCNCRHGNVSEFVLNSINAAAAKGEHQHVKIAPKPTSKSLKQRMTAATVKKNVAVLFAMAFMVTLNVGNFQTYLNKNSIENGGAGIMDTAAEEPIAVGRRLLWVETETEFNEKLNRSKRSNELEVPPLHFLRPVNRTNSTAAAAAEQQSYGKANEPPSSPPLLSPKNIDDCSSGSSSGSCLTSNQTENLRLASNLHKWIGGNDYLNLSLHNKNDIELENPHVGFKLTPDYFELKAMNLPLQGTALPAKRKIYMDYDKNKQRKFETATTTTATTTDKKRNDNNNELDNDKNSLKIFKPQISEEYLRLFKGIKRQEDTFYVLSFNMEHILLPASAYNKSARPKMSLMLPAGDPTLNGDIVLMQIDCEVVNTTELELKSHMIPAKLRPSMNKFDNVNLQQTQKSKSNNETTEHNNNNNNSNNMNNANKREKTHIKYELPKEKPPVRTYFMVGPKNQAAAAASLQKPRIVKLNSSDLAAVGGAGALNITNSTLFAKMRETVQGDFGP